VKGNHSQIYDENSVNRIAVSYLLAQTSQYLKRARTYLVEFHANIDSISLGGMIESIIVTIIVVVVLTAFLHLI